ncbi:hypothetical protein KSP40_PGU001241 [Platanthera guangdongensis]|uniref:Amidase domain-containing protein n=1 Tax=Platanthera guangdongensis TaxID=2320717 RepID=A0ABR2MSJ5_9ASPA
MKFSTAFSLLNFLLLLPLLLAMAVSALRVSGFASVRDSRPTMAAGKRLLLQAPFEFEEATVAGIQAAFKGGSLTSYQLVQHYLNQITALNPKLNAVIEVNPDALAAASQADRRRSSAGGPIGPFDGIPVLVKDSISTRDKLNTTAGSLALLGSVVPRDAGVIKRLRDAGAVILGKASMSEWDHFRSLLPPQGWSPRGGQGKNPYPGTENPCGTSSGSAIAVAANLVAVSLGTDLDGAISCPAAFNSVVGIKPTVGLTSRSGIMPISPRLDTVGPMARTVADAAALLDVIAGIDPLDKGATEAAAKFIPNGGFLKYLNVEGLNGKRIGILRHPFVDQFLPGSLEEETFAGHFRLMSLPPPVPPSRFALHLPSQLPPPPWPSLLLFWQKGAIVFDNVELKNANIMLNQTESGETITLLAEFKLSLNSYLKDLVSSPVRSLADVIAFNNQNPTEERMKEFGQIIFLASEKTNGIGAAEKNAMSKMVQLRKEGIEDLMKEKSLDALIFSEGSAAHLMALGGYPIVSVPAGYSKSGSPFGISFAGLLGSDAKLIEIAYAFEQATKIRKSPPHA